MRTFAKFYLDKNRATAIEYGPIAGLIAVVIITGLAAVGTNLNSMFNRISSTLS